MNAESIIRVLLEKHKGDICIREFMTPCSRFIDLWCISYQKGHTAYSYEIKVSKADFLKDIKHPDKQRGALTFSDFFYYVAPPGVIPVKLLPAYAGLIEIDPVFGSGYDIIKKAYRREKCSPTWKWIVKMLSRPKLNIEL